MPLATFQQDDHLGEIVIDSPPQNLYSAQLLADLRAAVDEAAGSDIRALLLRAEGDDFSAGAELTVFIGIDEAQARELSSTVLSLIEAIEDLPVPTLALIHGQCYAGALEVCLSCDLIWAAEGSQIGQIEAVAGSIPYAGGTQRIASRIGAGRAAEGAHGRHPARGDACVLGPHQPSAPSRPHRRGGSRLRPKPRARSHPCSRRHQTRSPCLALGRRGRGRPGNPRRGPGRDAQPGHAGRHRKPPALRPGTRQLQQPLNDIAARRRSRIQDKNQLLGTGLPVCLRMGDRHTDRGSLG